ncbi:MAG: glycosyltransferase family 1 protein [Anaerolineae bacterium]|nr:glycosyltransferase family 1 protein [Anaerolineae bacterium]MDW7992627.1 glycosyltransferase family 1 protein [Anaerolineae bacterium]
MRIALFTEVFLPKTDGVVNTLCRLLEHLARRGHRAILFAPAGGPTEYAGTPVIGLPALPLPFYPEVRLVPPLVDVRETLVAFRPDLVHVFNPVSLGLVGLYLAREMGIPVAASYQTDLPGFVQRWGMGFFSEPLWNFLRWVHEQADLNFCPSQFTLRQLERRGFRNLRVWGRGVDTGQFHPLRASPEWRERLSGGHPEAPLILTVGRLSPEKRVAMLRPMLDALPGVRLAIVGDGPERWALERLFAGTPTVFTGYLRGADLAAAYASADIFVLTGANETFGNVVLEAMASGLPVVVPHTGGQIDYVRDGVNGLVYEAEEEASLISQVGRLVEHPGLARQLGTAGRAYAETQTWERVLDRLIADWAALLLPARPAEPICPGLPNAREMACSSSPVARRS